MDNANALKPSTFQTFENSLDYQKLVLNMSCFNGKGLRPHPTQSIRQLRNFLNDVAFDRSPLISKGSQESIIVIGLDAISYSVAREMFTPNTMLPISSIFPSTSVCCWAAAMTGLSVEDSGLPGPVFYAPEIKRMYNCLDDIVEVNGKWVSDFSEAHKVSFGEWETIFHDLSQTHETVAVNGYFSIDSHRWSRGIMRGAERTDISNADWSKITSQPDKIAKSVVNDIENTLSKRDRNRPLFVWSLVNTDHYIHLNGYNESLRKALKLINEAFHEWSDQGHSVIMYADHGQVSNVANKEMGRAWDSLHSPEMCRLTSGGAGRVRWSYPHSHKEDAFANRLSNILGDEAIVLHRDELQKNALLDIGKRLTQQVGEIVSIAIGNQFPIFNSSEDYYAHEQIIFEHGSILPDEMIVPLALYQGKK